MKNIMKRMCGLFTAGLVLLTTGCSTPRGYRNEQTAEQVLNAVARELGEEDYLAADEEVYTFWFDGEEALPLVSDCCIINHKDTLNVNEIGVFRVAREEDTAAVASMLSDYVEEQQAYLGSFAKTYQPTENEKIDNARVHVLGCYVVYGILNPTDEARVLKVIEGELKG